jgi:hypothetical protein
MGQRGEEKESADEGGKNQRYTLRCVSVVTLRADTSTFLCYFQLYIPCDQLEARIWSLPRSSCGQATAF